MLSKKELKEYSANARENYLPHISIDCVVFGFHEGVMKVLLLKMKNEDAWYLPGGFVLKQEPIEAAATRILKERTGLDKIFLRQFHVFGEPERAKEHFDMYKDMVPAKDNWFANRFLTIGYYALVDFFGTTPMPDELSGSCEWRDLGEELPELRLDHSAILKTALDTLRLQLNYQPIGYNLMPKEFTMPELQKLYETILDKKLDRRNFQRRMLGFGILKRSEQLRKGGAHKAPYLYSFDLENYQAALTEGFKGGW
jgi:ADP-ribose pyrophosphatase YjhB (NUDIX family)